MVKSIIQNEEWKDIPGYEGRYMVSNWGRIKSLKVNRYVHGTIMEIEREHIMRQTDNGNGYLIVTLRKGDGTRENIYVHRAVASAFLENAEGKDVINHKDFNKSNNHVDNLEWCTQKENTHYSINHMRILHNAPLPKTGEKYITQKKKSFRVNIGQLGIDKTFHSLHEAVRYRDNAMRDLYEFYNAD